MSQDLVSVVIPCYNYGHFLERCIQSVTRQTWRKMEIIVVDDGSIDNTAVVAKSAITHDSRVLYFRQDNVGYPSAHNRGLEEARGDYILVLDADDTLASDSCIERLVAAIKESPDVVAVYGLTQLIDEKDTVLKTLPSPRISGSITPQLVYRDFIPLGSALVSSRVSKAAKFDARIPFMQDFLYKIRISTHGYCKCVDTTVLSYRMHTGSVSRNRIRLRKDTLRTLEIAAAELPTAVSTKGWAIAFSRAHFELAKEYERHNHLELARTEYATAVKRRCSNWRAAVLLGGTYMGGLLRFKDRARLK